MVQRAKKFEILSVQLQLQISNTTLTELVFTLVLQKKKKKKVKRKKKNPTCYLVYHFPNQRIPDTKQSLSGQRLVPLSPKG